MTNKVVLLCLGILLLVILRHEALISNQQTLITENTLLLNKNTRLVAENAHLIDKNLEIIKENKKHQDWLWSVQKDGDAKVEREVIRLLMQEKITKED